MVLSGPDEIFLKSNEILLKSNGNLGISLKEFNWNKILFEQSQIKKSWIWFLLAQSKKRVTEF